MPGFQPRMTTDHVWYNGTDIHTYAIATGLGIRITEIRGWDERVDVRDVRELRHGQHGEWADNVYLGGRTITIMGVVHGSTWVNLQARKRELMALFAPTATEVLLKIPDPATASPTGSYSTTGMTGYERASVRPIEGLMFGDMVGSCAMTFQVVLRASDPRIYSDTETSTDSGTSGTATRTATVDQGGTFETPTTVTATGPTGSAWYLTEPTSGLSLAMSGLTLASGDSVAFDTSARTVTLSGTYQTTRDIIASSLVAGWMLNETSGTTADNFEGTSTYDLTYTGGFTLNQSGPNSMTAVDLNGTTGYLTKSYTAALNPSSMTIEGWVLWDAITGTSRPIASSYNGDRGWQLTAPNGVVYMLVGSDDGGVPSSSGTSGASVTTATWYHVAATVDGTTGSVRVYLNGELKHTHTRTFVASDGGNFRLGNIGGTYHDGKMGPWALYNTVLSASQIADLYAANAATSSINAYPYLVASGSRWANLGTGSSTFSYASDGLNTGSKVNVAYRDARL